jgi:two-component sensor histidine kinase
LNSSQPDSLGEAYVMLWSSSWLAGLDYAGRIPILDKAWRAFEQAGNTKRLADVLTDEAELYYLTDSTPAALHMALQASRLYQSIKFPNLQENYNVLSSIYTRLGDYNEAVRYGLLSIRTAEARGDTSASLAAYNNHLAVAYTYLNQLDESEPYFQRGLNVALKYHDTGSVVQLAVNLANTMVLNAQYEKSRKFLIGQLAAHPAYFARDSIMIGTRLLEIYNWLRQFKRGEPFVKMLKNFIPHEEAPYYLRTDAALRVSTYYMGQGELDSARYYLDYFANVAMKNKMTQAYFYIPYYSFRLDSLSGNYLEAIRQYERYKSASDSIQGATRYQQLAQYSALYESGQKDRSILQLRQQADVQANRLRQEVFLRRVTIGGVALLLVLVSLLYYAYRIKQRSNRMLEGQRKEIAQKNQRLERLVKEKDWLVKEVHHRVKNNLQIVMSLLNSQSAFIDNEHALTAIHESQHRVHAMSLIHQKLYNSENTAAIDMVLYIRELVSYLQDSFNTGQRIRFELDIAPLSLDVSQAVPVGLILNEAITNSIKYAFPDNRKGTIGIELSKDSPTHYFLCITDNGIGMPAQIVNKKTGSLGMSLMAGLSADLDGTFVIESNGGTVIKIAFVCELDTSPKHAEIPSFENTK